MHAHIDIYRWEGIVKRKGERRNGDRGKKEEDK